MKIRYLSLIVLLVMSVFAPMQAQTYDNLWKELEVLERKDLPKSVISEAMKIYDKAKAEQNVPQMMKAYLTAMQYRSLLTPDSLKVDMTGLEQWASQTGSMEDKAILYSILGEMTMPADVKKGLEMCIRDRSCGIHYRLFPRLVTNLMPAGSRAQPVHVLRPSHRLP